ncbi:helix-turn-helix domain-containing protein [Marisediminicola senii]|uniref:ArsR family transcriptional regulator n=1 Tax=Marisediminicola senii TaxID=2711233 RepID=UPI0019141F67|nr:ArsR family transcriptional regulator [Marisediminicola senii]
MAPPVDPLVLIAELAERVRVLEGRASQQSVAAEASDDPLWIVNGIKKRVPSPGAVYFAGAVQVAAGPVEWQVGFPTDRILEDDWTSLAGSIAALGNPVRLSLMHAVLSGATSVAELSAGEGMGTTGQLYHHLGHLVAQGWLLAPGRGHYSIPAERVVPLLVMLSAARRTM